MRRFLLVWAFEAALATSVNAQWPSFVRQETPRTSEGKPDLNAPPPRLPNGKVDFSGTWESRQPPSGRLGGPMVPNLNPTTDPPLANFANIGQNFKDGLPFTSWAAELRKQRMASNSKENPDANCLRLGFMQLHTHSQPRKVVQNVNDIVIMYEANSGLRNIFTDGRALPTVSDVMCSPELLLSKLVYNQYARALSRFLLILPTFGLICADLSRKRMPRSFSPNWI